MSEIVRRSRSRSLITVDMPSSSGFVRGGARVGYETTGTVGAYAGEIDKRYDLLDYEIRTKFAAKWGAGTFVVKGKFGDADFGKGGVADGGLVGFDASGFKYSYAFSPEKEAVIPADRLADYKSDREFYASWDGALGGWRSYYVSLLSKSLAPGWLEASGEHDKVVSYDVIHRDWQKLASDRGIQTTTPPAPPQTDEFGNPLDGFSGLMKNLVWIVGAGVGFYVFTMFIAPALLGGAARTKEGYRQVRAA